MPLSRLQQGYYRSTFRIGRNDLVGNLLFFLSFSSYLSPLLVHLQWNPSTVKMKWHWHTSTTSQYFPLHCSLKTNFWLWWIPGCMFFFGRIKSVFIIYIDIHLQDVSIINLKTASTWNKTFFSRFKVYFIHQNINWN